MSKTEISLTSHGSEIVALVGAPNSGKTTLYNWLTASHAKAVNYPGSTVDYMKGEVAKHWDIKASVLDTPGTYSLQAKTEDEVVTRKILMDSTFSMRPQRVVVVVDGTQMSRHLLLADQVRQLGIPMILAITMADLLKSQNLSLNIEPLKKYFNCPVVQIDGRLGGGVQALIAELKKPIPPISSAHYQVWSSEEIENKVEWSEKLTAQVLGSDSEPLTKLWNNTLKWDRVLLHPLFGIILFVLIMGALFSSIYWLAAPVMEQFENVFSWTAGQLLAFNSESLFIDFLANGIVTSFGSVFVFVPQIFILFFGLSFLESSGYLARAATLIDKPFSKLGLSGRSFVPFLSGYACAVPALMAVRNINSTRERWIARMIIPLLSCSARLPVYGLLLGFVFWNEPAWKPGLSLAGLYLFSMLLSALAAGVLHKFVPNDKRSFFLMELPLYRRPLFKNLLFQAWLKTKSFILRAGPVIFVLTVILWVGSTFPNHHLPDQEKIQTSYLGQVGQAIEPVFKPLGLDWRGGVGLLAAFAAREVFVSTLAVVHSVSEEAGDEGLIAVMQNAQFPDGSLIYTPAVAWGLMVFFLIALQCLSTVGMMVKESQSTKLALIQLFAFNGIAYILAVITVQGLRAMGIS